MKNEEESKNMKQFKFFLLMSNAGYAHSYYPTMEKLFEDIIKLKEELKIAKEDNKILLKNLRNASSEAERFRSAGDAMDNAITELDPQRLERSRYGRMTDAEYVAVMKWRTTKNPDYNKA